jgi:small-conductance mechanosensitive channel
MITVKQLADKLEVSKPTITRNKPENMSFHVEQNTYYIDEELEKQITENVLKNKRRYTADTKDETEDNTLTQQLLQENAFLREQIKEQTKLLDQQQRLNLMANNKLKALEQKKETEPERTETRSEDKRSLFKRIFNK